MNKYRKLCRVAAFFVEEARAEQKQLHSQWFYFNQQPEHHTVADGDYLLSRHDELDRVIMAFRAFQWRHGHDTAKPARSRVAEARKSELARFMAEEIIEHCEPNQLEHNMSSADIWVSARHYLKPATPVSEEPRGLSIMDPIADDELTQA